MEKLDRLEFDMTGKIVDKAQSALPDWPDVLDPESMEKMKVIWVFLHNDFGFDCQK